MFNLIYRDGAPENTGHYEVFDKATGSGRALTVGQLVSVSGGIASAYSSGKPYGVVAINAADGENEVTVLRITDDMIFETRCEYGSDPTQHSNHARGNVLTANDKTVTNTIASSGYGFEISEVEVTRVEDFGAVQANIKGRFVNLGA